MKIPVTRPTCPSCGALFILELRESERPWEPAGVFDSIVDRDWHIDCRSGHRWQVVEYTTRVDAPASIVLGHQLR